MRMCARSERAREIERKNDSVASGVVRGVTGAQRGCAGDEDDARLRSVWLCVRAR